MTGPGDPPEGTPGGTPGGGEDEYRSVVFDESFIRAARLQEFSAQERIGDHAPAVRNRRPWTRSGASRQLVILIVLIAMAFGTAIYMGVRHPYQRSATTASEPLRSTLIPLAPRGAVPGASPADLFAHSPAAHFRSGAEGVKLPAARPVGNFSDSQALTALSSAREYVVRSTLDPEVLTGGGVRSVRLLLDPAQLRQFDRSMGHSENDGRHAATGWLVRFDASRVSLADGEIRVRGSFGISQAGPNALEVTADHTFVYALRSADAENSDQASLFTVRREMRFRFDREDLRDQHVEVMQTYLQAGPLSCGSDPAGRLQPLLAGQKAEPEGPAGTDPYAPGRARAALCGALAPGAMPSPSVR